MKFVKTIWRLLNTNIRPRQKGLTRADKIVLSVLLVSLSLLTVFSVVVYAEQTFLDKVVLPSILQQDENSKNLWMRT